MFSNDLIINIVTLERNAGFPSGSHVLSQSLCAEGSPLSSSADGGSVEICVRAPTCPLTLLSNPKSHQGPLQVQACFLRVMGW